MFVVSGCVMTVLLYAVYSSEANSWVRVKAKTLNATKDDSLYFDAQKKKKKTPVFFFLSTKTMADASSC